MIIEFEGRKIEVPDDFTDDEVAEVLASQTPDEGGGMLSAAGNALAEVDRRGGVAVRAARQSLSQFLGLPFDLAHIGIQAAAVPAGDALGVNLRAKPPSQAIDAVLGSPIDAVQAVDKAVGSPIEEGLGYSLDSAGPAPQDTLDRILQRIGYEAGATAVPVGGAIAGVRVLGPAAVDAMASSGESLVSRLFGTAMQAGQSPGSLAAREGAAALAAGTGAGVANELAGAPQTGDNFVSDTIGSILSVLALSGAGAVAQGGNDLVSLLRGGEAADNVVGGDVAHRIIENSTDFNTRANVADPYDTRHLAEALRRPSPAEQTVPGYQANIGDRTQDPGLQTLAYNVDGAQPGRAITRRVGNEEAVAARISELKPDGDPALFRDALETARADMLGWAQGRATQEQADFDALVQQLTPIMGESSARGSQARQALSEAYATAKASVDARYNEMRDNRVRVDPAPLAEMFAQTESKLPLNDRQRFLPSEAGVPAQLATPPDAAAMPAGRDTAEAQWADLTGGKAPRPPGPAKVGFDEIRSIRSGLTDDIRKANATPGEAQRSRVANMFLGNVDTYLRDRLPKALRTKYEDANRARRDLGDRFERSGTAMQAILQEGPGGGYKLDDSAVTSKLLPTDTGKTGDFRAAMREAGTDPRLTEALQDELLNDIRRRGLMENPDGLERYLGERNVVLGEFPQLRDRLQEVIGAGRTNREAQQLASDVTSEMTTPSKSPVAKYLQHSDAATVNAMNEVIASKDPGGAMRQLIETAGDTPEARANARAAFWQVVSGKTYKAKGVTGNERFDVGKLDKMFSEPKFDAVARELWSDDPKALDNLRELFSTLSQAEGSSRARVPGASGTAQITESAKGTGGPSIASLSSRFRSANEGRTSKQYFAISIATELARKATRKSSAEAINRVMAEAVNDPSLAAALLEKHNPADIAKASKMLTQKWGGRISNITSLLDEPEESEKKGN